MAGRSGIGGAEIPVARAPEETGGMDLMTALRLSLEKVHARKPPFD
jgi:hypothetical protein